MDVKKPDSEAVNAQKESQEELKEAELDEVAGAGNPFENIPRVPLQPIDDELRKKG